jgi:hypothetical protein
MYAMKRIQYLILVKTLRCFKIIVSLVVIGSVMSCDVATWVDTFNQAIKAPGHGYGNHGVFIFHNLRLWLPN